MAPRNTTTVQSVNLDRGLWLLTNEEVKGDWTRVQIVGPTEVVIYNSYEAMLRAQLRASQPVPRKRPGRKAMK
jgi:hypothetical protein